MQYSQEHLKTMVYAKFGGQTECIMGNWKIENTEYKMGTWFCILGWILSILTIAGNGFTVLLVGIRRRLRTKINALIVSLALADFCVGAFAVPSLFFCEIRGGCSWPQRYASWVDFIRWLFLCASIMNLCSLVLMNPIAIDEPLNMVKSDEIEVAMIAFDEATIALPSDQV